MYNVLKAAVNTGDLVLKAAIIIALYQAYVEHMFETCYRYRGDNAISCYN